MTVVGTQPAAARGHQQEARLERLQSTRSTAWLGAHLLVCSKVPIPTVHAVYCQRSTSRHFFCPWKPCPTLASSLSLQRGLWGGNVIRRQVVAL